MQKKAKSEKKHRKDSKWLKNRLTVYKSSFSLVCLAGCSPHSVRGHLGSRNKLRQLQRRVVPNYESLRLRPGLPEPAQGLQRVRLVPRRAGEMLDRIRLPACATDTRARRHQPALHPAQQGPVLP